MATTPVFSAPRVDITYASCPADSGAVYPRITACASNWWFNISRIVMKLRDAPNPFTTFLLADTEAAWDAFFAIPSFTHDAALYSPGYKTTSSLTPVMPDIFTTAWGGKIYGNAKGSEAVIPFSNLQGNVMAEMMTIVNASSNNWECMFVTNEDRLVFQNNNGLTPTAPKWIPIQAAWFGEPSAAEGQATLDNMLNITFEPKSTAYLNLLPLSFSLVNKG